jgi:hypothetical protein
MSTTPQAIAPNPHTNLLNVCIQIANKMGFQQQQKMIEINLVDGWFVARPHGLMQSRRLTQ